MQASKQRPAGKSRVNLNARIPAALDHELSVYAARCGRKKQEVVEEALRRLLAHSAADVSLDAPLPGLQRKAGAGEYRALTGLDVDRALFG